MSQHPLVRIPGGCPAEDRRVSVGLQREPSSPSSQGSEPSGIRSGSDGNRRGLTFIVDQKARASHEAKSSTSKRSSFRGQVPAGHRKCQKTAGPIRKKVVGKKVCSYIVARVPSLK